MTRYYIWLQLLFGRPYPRSGELLRRGFSPRDLYENRLTTPLFSPRVRKKAQTLDIRRADEILLFCEQNGIGILTPDMSLYPRRLYEIMDPPFVLYYKGTLPCFEDKPVVCIVGPRKVSDYGYKSAYSISARLSRAGFLVISGGAVGCDYAAHDGALVHGFPTVAVLGHGFGATYLKVNEPLRERIVQNGCLLTEYPPMTPPSRCTFPLRNRLLSALSLGTIVVEAGKKSGALITANDAIEQGRDLFVIPGTPTDPQYQGSNELLLDGAVPLLDLSCVFGAYLTDYADKIDIKKAYDTPLIQPVLGERPVKRASTIKEEKTKVPTAPKTVHKEKKKILPECLSKTAKLVYNQLSNTVFTCDDLVSCTLGGDQVAAALGELEIFGLIEALPGGRYTLR